MCRNIRVLYNLEPTASVEEVRAAALQYVRKVSGYREPSRANAEVFESAVDAIAEATRELLDGLTTSAPAKDRDELAARARARSSARYA